MKLLNQNYNKRLKSLFFSYLLLGDIMLSRVKDYILNQEFRITFFENRLLAINFIKILSLEEERVSFLTSYGRVVVKGREFSLIRLLESEVLVSGIVENVEVFYE